MVRDGAEEVRDGVVRDGVESAASYAPLATLVRDGVVRDDVEQVRDDVVRDDVEQVCGCVWALALFSPSMLWAVRP